MSPNQSPHSLSKIFSSSSLLPPLRPPSTSTVPSTTTSIDFNDPFLILPPLPTSSSRLFFPTSDSLLPTPLPASRIPIFSLSLLRSLSAPFLSKSPLGPSRPNRKFQKTCLLTSLLLALSTAFLLFAVFHLALGRLLFTQLHRSVPLEHQLKRALLIDLPDRVLLENIGQQSLSLSLDARLAIDVRRLLGWEHKDSGSPWARLEAAFARAFVARSPHATVLLPCPVELRQGSSNHSAPADAQQMLLVTFRSPLRIPLAYPPHGPPSTAPVPLALDISFPSPDTLARFLSRSWHDQRALLALAVQDVHVQLDGDALAPLLQRLLRQRSATTIPHFHSLLTLKLPPLPPVLADPAQTVRIDRYSFRALPAPAHGLGILATASLVNPLHVLNQALAGRLHVNLPIPWPFPLAVLFDHPSGQTLMATADTRPFSINTSAPRLAVTIEGRVVPQTEGSTNALSGFLDRFLQGLATNVTVRSGGATSVAPEIVRALGGLDTQTVLGESRAGPPAFLTRLLADMAVPIAFPGARSTDLVSDLRVAHMRIGVAGTRMMCSGTITGELKLPGELAQVVGALAIDAIRPDVILLDGPIPANNLIGPAEDYPPNAFGRLVTPTYVRSSLVGDTDSGKRTLVAKIKDVPIEVLPGRGPVFRKYAAKYVFRRPKEGLLTSVLGNSRAKGKVNGVGEIEIEKIGVRGTFFVGGSGEED